MKLPLRLPPEQMEQQWKSILDPVLSNPINSASILSQISLKVGVNVINHLLGKIQQGWFLTDQRSLANIYRSQPFNDLTLTLTSDAVVIVNIGVF